LAAWVTGPLHVGLQNRHRLDAPRTADLAPGLGLAWISSDHPNQQLNSSIGKQPTRTGVLVAKRGERGIAVALQKILVHIEGSGSRGIGIDRLAGGATGGTFPHSGRDPGCRWERLFARPEAGDSLTARIGGWTCVESCGEASAGWVEGLPPACGMDSGAWRRRGVSAPSAPTGPRRSMPTGSWISWPHATPHPLPEANHSGISSGPQHLCGLGALSFDMQPRGFVLLGLSRSPFFFGNDEI